MVNDILCRSSPLEVFSGSFPENMQKFTRKRPCQSVISTKLLSKFIEITFLHECKFSGYFHIFRTEAVAQTCSVKKVFLEIS